MSGNQKSQSTRNFIVAVAAVVLIAVFYVPRMLSDGKVRPLPFSSPSRNAETEKIDARLKELLEKGAKVVERQMAGEDVGDDSLVVFNELVDLAEKAGDSLGAQDAKYLSAIAKAMADLSPSVRAYNALLRETMPALEYTGLDSQKEIARRIELLTRYDAANTALRVAFEKMPAAIEANFRAAGVAESRIRKFMDDPGRRDTANSVNQIRLAEAEGIALFQAQFELMHTHWGKWRYDTDGAIEFDDDETAAEFDANVAKAAAIAERQESHQRNLVNSMRNRARK